MDERDDGLRRQLEHLGGRAVAGWKVGLTSGRGRDSMGAGFRPFGYILAEQCFESGVEIALADLGRGGLENELCFSFAHDLKANASRDEVIAAVETVAPAFEINQHRLGADATTADRLADDLSQWGIVIGATKALDWAGFDFSNLTVSLSSDGETVEEVAAAGHIDDHFDSLAALSATLARFDRRILAGDRVITGSYTRQSVPGPSVWRGDFGAEIGTVEVKFV